MLSFSISKKDNFAIDSNIYIKSIFLQKIVNVASPRSGVSDRTKEFWI